MTTQTNSKPAAKRVRKMAREPGSTPPIVSQQVTQGGAQAEGVAPATNDKPKSKASRVLDLLRRDGGATLEQLVATTGWLPHTTRAALTGIKKKGHALSSEKVDGVRTYRVSSVGAAP